MISKKMEEEINDQINREMYSGYLYMAMSAKASERGYTGTATWFMIQYHEEMFHAMKFYHYLLDQGAVPVLGAIAKPEVKEADMKSWFVKTLAHEKTVTANIHNLMALALGENDHATRGLLDWYVKEQVEEEKNAQDILTSLSLLGESAHGAFLLNIELGKRALGVPSDFSRGLG